MAALRELWHLRVLPIFQRPAVRPGLRIAKFADMRGDAGPEAANVVPQVIAETLNEWNQLVERAQIPIESAAGGDLGAMSWIKVLWHWLLPGPRGYEVTGTLLDGPAGVHRLVVQRAELTNNRIDRSATFENTAPTAEAYRAMAGEAAKWLISPIDIEADRAVLAVRQTAGEAAGVTSSAAFDQALEWLLPVRRQISQGQIDFGDARRRLQRAEAMIGQAGARPIYVGDLPAQAARWSAAQLYAHELTVDAAVEGSREKAIMALACDPMIRDFHEASAVFDALIEAQEGRLDRFKR